MKELRVSRDLEPYELAVKLGVHPTTVWRWETVGAIPDKNKHQLAGFFDVSIAYLMGWDTEKAA